MPAAQKAEKQQVEKQQTEESMISFVPAGMPRSIAEYAVSMLAGAILFFAFFFLAEALMLLKIGGDIMAVTFLPVICVLPLLSGAIATLALEKIRGKQLTIKRGAAVGAAAGLVGSLSSSLLALVLLLIGQKPFGGMLADKILSGAALLVIIGVVTILAALGGALVVKFIKDV